jgi:hypothetical protein
MQNRAFALHVGKKSIGGAAGLVMYIAITLSVIRCAPIASDR